MSAMALTLNRPPTLLELLEDPIFAKFMRTRPRIPANLARASLTPMWHVWLLTTEDTWKRGRFHTYDEAYRAMKKRLVLPTTADVAIVNIRMFTPPPAQFYWRHRRNPWCARCRRPSLFITRYTHRALGNAETTVDEPNRCFYCGIRRAALPNYSPRRV